MLQNGHGLTDVGLDLFAVLVALCDPVEEFLFEFEVSCQTG